MVEASKTRQGPDAKALDGALRTEHRSIMDDAAQKLLADLKDAQDDYRNRDPKELAATYASIVLSMSEANDGKKALSFGESISDSPLGLLAQITLSSTLISNLKVKSFEDPRWGAFMDIYGNLEVMSMVIELLHDGSMTSDAAHKPFAKAIFSSALGAMSDQNKGMAEIFEDLRSEKSGKGKTYGDFSPEEMEKLILHGAELSRRVSAIMEKRREKVNRGGVLQSDEGKKAAEWVSAFTGTVNERIGKYLEAAKANPDV
jgi:hypothetical protein